MIKMIKGEGLLEYVRRQETMEKELSQISGIPKKYFGREQKGITIIGGSEFIKKFVDGLPDEYKNSK